MAPRPRGTIAQITGRIEPQATLRRLLRACYRDWISLDQARAHHMTKRLFEQLTGRLDADAAMRAALHRDFDSNSVQATEIGHGSDDDRRNRWDFDRD